MSGKRILISPWIAILIPLLFTACEGPKNEKWAVNVIDTDFSKGRLTHIQEINLEDLVHFHGHLCDGLVVGALAFSEGAKALGYDTIIDRTNLRMVSKPAPCLTDAAIYLSGGRYQYNTFYVDAAFQGIYILQRIDNEKTVSVLLKPGVKPAEIDRLGNLANAIQLSPCGLDSLRKLEDAFTESLLKLPSSELFSIKVIPNFKWEPQEFTTYPKTDILNKNAPPC